MSATKTSMGPSADSARRAASQLERFTLKASSSRPEAWARPLRFRRPSHPAATDRACRAGSPPLGEPFELSSSRKSRPSSSASAAARRPWLSAPQSALSVASSNRKASRASTDSRAARPPESSPAESSPAESSPADGRGRAALGRSGSCWGVGVTGWRRTRQSTATSSWPRPVPRDPAGASLTGLEADAGVAPLEWARGASSSGGIRAAEPRLRASPARPRLAASRRSRLG